MAPRRAVVAVSSLLLGACAQPPARTSLEHPKELVGRWVRAREDSTWGDTLTYVGDGSVLGSTGHAVPAGAWWVYEERAPGSSAPATLLSPTVRPSASRATVWRWAAAQAERPSSGVFRDLPSDPAAIARRPPNVRCTCQSGRHQVVCPSAACQIPTSGRPSTKRSASEL